MCKTWCALRLAQFFRGCTRFGAILVLMKGCAFPNLLCLLYSSAVDTLIASLLYRTQHVLFRKPKLGNRRVYGTCIRTSSNDYQVHTLAFLIKVQNSSRSTAHLALDPIPYRTYIWAVLLRYAICVPHLLVHQFYEFKREKLTNTLIPLLRLYWFYTLAVLYFPSDRELRS